MYSFLSSFYPKALRNAYYNELNYYDINIRKEFLLGSLLFFSLGISLSVAFQFSNYFFANSHIHPFLAFLITFISFFILTHLLVFFIISIISINRGRFLESILPDALELVSANLRAGMTIDRALIASGRKEFGYLNYLLNIVGREITTGKEISDSLMDMTKKVKSEKFFRTMELVVMAMKSGGELSRLLGQVAENLVHQKNIEDKVKAGVTTYLIFIGAAVSFAAPFLYGLSSVFVKIIVTSFSGIDIPKTGSGGASVPFSINLSPEMAEFLPQFVKTYAKVSLGSLSIMSSFLLGFIKKGKAKFGISYIPFILLGSLATYYAISYLADLLFSSIM